MTAAEAIPTSGTSATDGSRYVLYTEDSPTDKAFFQRSFKKSAAGVALIHYDNGSDAWNFLREQLERNAPLPSLVILDLKMPGYSGLELLELIRQHPALRFLPTILLSASYETSDISKAYDYAVSAYLVKPNRYRDLNQLVESLSIFWLGFNRTPDPS